MTIARRCVRLHLCFAAMVAVTIVSACEAEPPVDPLILTDRGLGPITKDTPFDGAAIGDLYPDFVVEPDLWDDASGRYPVLHVIEGDQILFTIVPNPDATTIFRIEVSNPFVTVANGTAIGDSFDSSILAADAADPAEIAAACARGEAELARFVVCPAPGYRHIAYAFDGPWDGALADMPTPANLARWSLAQIFWTP